MAPSPEIGLRAAPGRLTAGLTPLLLLGELGGRQQTVYEMPN